MTRSLTPREIEVVEAYIRLGTRKAVAYELRLSPNTVRNYHSNIMRKLGVESITQACVAVDRQLRAVTWPEIERRTGPSDRRASA